MRKISFILTLTIFLSCNEKYDFNVLNQKKGIVIEAQISNVSFTESLSVPSDGRYFSVLLRETNDVDNIRDSKISDAKVTLKDDDGHSWSYEEDVSNPGLYLLNYQEFKAQPLISYQLQVQLSTGQQFESDWEKIPQEENALGEISINEVRTKVYAYQAEERVIIDEDGIDVYIDIPENKKGNTRHLLWSFEPMWTYAAALAEEGAEGKHCWVTSPNYLKDTEILEDRTGGYAKKLFNLKTTRNERVYDYFTVLIHQHVVSSEFYYFWKDLNEQREKGGLFDQPPFGLTTNFKAVNNDWSTNGYFSVTKEKMTRWELDRSKLSYPIEDDLLHFCELYYEPDPEGLDSCKDCRVYPRGTSLNYPPEWWLKKYKDPR
ncbi:DUF4249 family protein [Jiulongibacter sediminis]|uniref:DUF4249 domain-containing protein n=1 Tax=Jiulongibacter sediminis TaxID=1605367 RepID=A0A0P7BGA1_9BACT|nr:DUF4249 family protein [Jiulongibacter sediminis]KPM49975.1 hypothetical protein AFM12_05305 [Jiulongibacter sediminis]TBX27007.1 hypothetical protein TK44_05310 [Jiulongibacter sediminis]